MIPKSTGRLRQSFLEKVGGKPNVGKTVLHKLLYFIDFDYYEKFEENLMGATSIMELYSKVLRWFRKYGYEVT